MLAAGLEDGRYQNDGGCVNLGANQVIPASEVSRLIVWLNAWSDTHEALSITFAAQPRVRLSDLSERAMATIVGL